jgi:hypothetical protein
MVESFNRTYDAALLFISSGFMIRSSTKSHQLSTYFVYSSPATQCIKGCHSRIFVLKLKQA